MFRSLVTRVPKSIFSVKSESPLQIGGLRKISSDNEFDTRGSPQAQLENVDTYKCINRVTLLGRATGPAYITTVGTTPMASFTLATNELRRNRDNELIKRSEFHRVQIFIPKLVDKTKQVLQKGSRVLVDGKINYNVRKEENGNSTHFTNIIAENVVFITGTRQDTRNEREDGNDYEAENAAEAKY